KGIGLKGWAFLRAMCAGVFIELICVAFSKYAALATVDATADSAKAVANITTVTFFMVQLHSLKQDEFLAGDSFGDPTPHSHLKNGDDFDSSLLSAFVLRIFGADWNLPRTH